VQQKGSAITESAENEALAGTLNFLQNQGKRMVEAGGVGLFMDIEKHISY
jgi:hypothetical protein